MAADGSRAFGASSSSDSQQQHREQKQGPVASLASGQPSMKVLEWIMEYASVQDLLPEDRFSQNDSLSTQLGILYILQYLSDPALINRLDELISLFNRLRSGPNTLESPFFFLRTEMAVQAIMQLVRNKELNDQFDDRLSFYFPDISETEDDPTGQRKSLVKIRKTLVAYRQACDQNNVASKTAIEQEHSWDKFVVGLKAYLLNVCVDKGITGSFLQKLDQNGDGSDLNERPRKRVKKSGPSTSGNRGSNDDADVEMGNGDNSNHTAKSALKTANDLSRKREALNARGTDPLPEMHHVASTVAAVLKKGSNNRKRKDAPSSSLVSSPAKSAAQSSASRRHSARLDKPHSAAKAVEWSDNESGDDDEEDDNDGDSSEEESTDDDENKNKNNNKNKNKTKSGAQNSKRGAARSGKQEASEEDDDEDEEEENDSDDDTVSGDEDDDRAPRLPNTKTKKIPELQKPKSKGKGKKGPSGGSSRRKSSSASSSSGGGVGAGGRGEGGRRKPWSDEEVDELRRGISRFGAGRWAEILTHFDFSNRTSVDLKDKYRNLVKKGAM